MKTHFDKFQSAKILACYSNIGDLEKGGEGSRGGKIIGHTSSGTPIYDHRIIGKTQSSKPIHGDFNYPSHSNFTAQDHLDAAEANKASVSHFSEIGKNSIAKIHDSNVKSHLEASKQK